MQKPTSPKGNEGREAIASLGGYVYQIYQSALAWLELSATEFLFLEVAEDYVVAAAGALDAVQVKGTSHSVTINSDDIIASIDSFVKLRIENPQVEITLRHLTTSQIGKEKSAADRIGETPTLDMWRNLARTGDVAPLRNILTASKLSKKTKDFITSLDDHDFREKFLRKIHFDCGAPNFKFLRQQLQAKIINLLQDRGGVASQANECLNNIVICLLQKSIQKDDRFVDRVSLEGLLEASTHIPMNRAQLDDQNALIARALAGAVSKTDDLISTRLSEPRPVDEVPLPSAIAQRAVHIDSIVSTLEGSGVGWILGVAGVGKTVAARLAALRTGGSWASINLRGLAAEQVANLLYETNKIIMDEEDIRGLLIDDLECDFEPYLIDKLLYLLSICKRKDLLLLVTSPRPAPSEMLFAADLPLGIETKLGDFTQEDIDQILRSLRIEDRSWSKYIHLVSGGGHPQLVIATVQSMQRAGWDVSEFQTLNSLLFGSSELTKYASVPGRGFLKNCRRAGGGCWNGCL